METNEIFKILKSILKQYESHLVVVHNKSDHYYLNTAITEDNRKQSFSDRSKSKSRMWHFI